MRIPKRTAAERRPLRPFGGQRLPALGLQQLADRAEAQQSPELAKWDTLLGRVSRAADDLREETLSRQPETSDRSHVSSWLTLNEAALLLGISIKSVQRRIKNGLIRKAPIGGRLVRIPSDELRRLAAGELVPGLSEDPDM